MPIVDRLPFPRKYKLKQTVLLFAILAALFGLWLRSNAHKSQSKRIIIHSVGVERFDTQFVEITFEIENKGAKDEEVMLLTKVYNTAGEEVTSKLFQIRTKAQKRETRSEMIDKMTLPLKPGEKPYRITLELYHR
ncbi:MAG: hypothetical protein GX294_02805 [Candidatus Cloacimonetes bacterium]|nr:hypothetical protein [Candidatus Cloacimonadota bacterium]